ncbi:MAG TPA: response regulator [Chloroflexota bacterium]|nr:response regulator [Chloroflexota bacterium]
MIVHFWGTRGSIAAPGPSTVRYGGNTSCVQITSGDVLIVLDCGTGLRELGLNLMAASAGPIEGHLLVTHTHWDHIQGFPFFVPVLAPGNRFTIYSARGIEKQLEDIFAGQMDYTYFPLRLAQLQSDVSFVELAEETFSIGHVEVTGQFLNHTTLTMGYRLSSGGRSVVYATDHEPFGRMRPAGDPAGTFIHEGDRRLVSFAAGADVLIIDAQYTEEEYPKKVGWGHGTVEYAVEIGLAAEVKQLLLFHHDTIRSDQQLAGLEAKARTLVAKRGATMEVLAAAEGLEIALDEQGETARHGAAGGAQKPMVKHRLLLADDDAFMMRALKLAFNDDERYETFSAHNGAEAVDLALELKPDLILLDAIMPELDGFGVTRELRAELRTKDIPIVMLTSLEDPSFEAQGFELGVNDFMRKPFALPQLRARVEMWLRRGAQPTTFDWRT